MRNDQTPLIPRAAWRLTAPQPDVDARTLARPLDEQFRRTYPETPCCQTLSEGSQIHGICPRGTPAPWHRGMQRRRTEAAAPLDAA